jgi:hypothetical protein
VDRQPIILYPGKYYDNYLRTTVTVWFEIVLQLHAVWGLSSLDTYRSDLSDAYLRSQDSNDRCVDTQPSFVRWEQNHKYNENKSLLLLWCHYKAQLSPQC